MNKSQNIQIKSKERIHKFIGRFSYNIALLNLNTASLFFIYEPKLPKELNKYKKVK